MSESAESKDSVSIHFVRAALAGAEAQGLQREPLLQGAGIPESLLASDHSRIAAERFGALWLGIAAALDDELFGLDGRRMKVGSFAMLARACARAENLHGALRLAVQFFNITMDDARVSLVEGGDEARLEMEELLRRRRPPAFTVFAHETLLIMLHGLMCWLVGRRITLDRADFAYPRPAWWIEYRSMYANDLRFDTARSAIRFDARVLDANVVPDEAAVREFLREAPHNFIVKFKDRNSWSAHVRRRLRTCPPSDWPDLGRIAEELGVGLSTLHRKLDQEGAIFRDIKDSLRRDLAIDRLTHSDASIALIASELGFAEPSAFHRAFKQWTGVRPGDYRQRAVGAKAE
jgi:AraC-like DNA-binding protein